MNENRSTLINNQSKSKNVKNLKNGPKWSICKQSLKEKHQKQFHVENQNNYQNHSQIIEHQSKSEKKWKISKMVQSDRFVNKVVKEKHQKKFHFENWKIDENK